MAPWYLSTKPGGAGTMVQSSAYKTSGAYSARVNLTAASPASPWVVQLSQSKLPLASGRSYTIAFSARADKSRSLESILQGTASPYTMFVSRTHNLTTSWQAFNFTYTPTASIADASLRFNLASTTGSVWIDGVSLADSDTTPTPIPTPPPAQAKGVVLRSFVEYWGGNRAGMDADLTDLKNGGVTWARFDLNYTSSRNPSLDAAIESAKAHGIKVLVTVRKPWPDKDLGTQGDRDYYKSWLASKVNRYKYYVKHWEIQNEPNLHYEWNIDESTGSDQASYVASVQRYLAVLQDAHGVIKANDPDATVLFGGLSEWTVERYMDVVVTTDAFRYFDIMSFHPYGYNPDRVLSRFNSFKSKMNLTADYAPKPIWVSETGFNTSWNNKAGFVTTETTKADYLKQSSVKLYLAGAQLPLFWYTLHENDTSPGYGLTVRNKTSGSVQYLPAYYAYRDLVY